MPPRNLHQRRRREHLSALEDAIDPSTRHEYQEAVRALLQQPLLTPGGPGDESFGLVRKHSEWLRTWFAHHPGWQLDVTAEAARLRKTPASLGDASRPGRDPKTGATLTRRGYVYLSLAMAALVRADRQTTLGNLVTELASHLANEPRFAAAGVRSALESREERRELVSAIRLLLDWKVLLRVEGDEDRFVQDGTSDVLYSVHRPVLGRILASSQPPSLVNAASFSSRLQAIAEPALANTEEARHRRWRSHFFRRLLDDPVLYYDTLSEDERAYLDRQRASILGEIEKATGLVRELRAEGIAMVDPSNALTDYRLPEEGTEGHLTLLIAEHLAGFLRHTPQSAATTIDALTAFTASCIRTHRKHWRKGVLEPGADRALTELVLARLAALSLVRREAERVIPLPAVARYRLRPESADESDSPRKPAEPTLL